MLQHSPFRSEPASPGTDYRKMDHMLKGQDRTMCGLKLRFRNGKYTVAKNHKILTSQHWLTVTCPKCLATRAFIIEGMGALETKPSPVLAFGTRILNKRKVIK